MHTLTTELTTWNREVFGNLFQRKRKQWARTEGIQWKMANGGPRYLLKLDVKLHKELDITLNQIESLWHQKSRTDMIRDGDQNIT